MLKEPEPLRFKIYDVRFGNSRLNTAQSGSGNVICQLDPNKVNLFLKPFNDNKSTFSFFRNFRGVNEYKLLEN
ncbi:MAG TPA: hypothetical protein VK588_10525, partial [Chitinophagaceae bacterium]|nr:hypothetical protein [Chitinophagaceae bacterium]